MPLIAIIDTGATHSFISLDFAKRLNLELSVMRGSMVIDTPAMGSVTTSSVCLKCPLNICDKDFEVDLVCLPMSQLDVILGMHWLRANHVYINCFAKAILFLEPKKEVFMLVASLKLSENGTMGEFPVVRDFPEVFPDEVSNFPSEREVEFTIDLIPSTSLASMALYRMSQSDLKELKSQLEDLLDKSLNCWKKKKCENGKRRGKSPTRELFQLAAIYTATCVTAFQGFPYTRSFRSEGQAWK
ncbi:uncharacterized protein LOC127136049 [Lathyrus oleraceus]|uniref:uncharacterized protein LOC127136049 n=1 Tax=Pisum sativum TaxID=3888 RepID=UPI0021D0D1DE|nr:uncharacterized protein LOC127136049 [Pisum sativum]